jgi:hypothetical protein
LTPDQLAQSLVQLYGLGGGKAGEDYFRKLEREGITIDRSTGAVTRRSLANLVDEFGFQSRQAVLAKSSKSKVCDNPKPPKPTTHPHKPPTKPPKLKCKTVKKPTKPKPHDDHGPKKHTTHGHHD